MVVVLPLVNGFTVDKVVLNFVVAADDVLTVVGLEVVRNVLDAVLVVEDCTFVSSVSVSVVKRVLVAGCVVGGVVVVIVVVVDFVLGNNESTTPIGPSKSISDSGHVNSSD